MTLKGIDVSKHNGTMNWDMVKASGIQFAIIRCSWGHFREDEQLRRNVRECERVGLPYGFYHYSYATNPGEMVEEADALIKLIGEFNPTYPIYIDMEDADGYKQRMGTLYNKELNTEICRYTCERLEAAGYYAGIYANKDWLENKLNAEVLKPYDKWLAQWSSKPTWKGTFGVWQYSSDGKVPGSSARTDMNISYIDFDKLIRSKGLNRQPATGEDVPPVIEPSKKIEIGAKVKYSGYLYVNSYGNGRGKKVSGSFIVTRLVAGRKCGVHLDGLGWVPESDCELI